MQEPSPSIDDSERDAAPGAPAFPIIGLGASAGGLQALTDFFRNLPPDSGMAFVVILHLSPTHQSSAAQVLQAIAAIPVAQATDGAMLEPDHAYVIPPSKHLALEGGRLRLSDPKGLSGKPLAIDLFLRSLARERKEYAAAIVLSGAGSDGALGLASIKEEGGITIAQDPADAEYGSMPEAAIESGVVDIVLPAEAMPQKLIELWHNMRAMHLPPVDDPEAPVASGEDKQTGVAQTLLDIIALLQAHTGHDFRHYKRATVVRRIERRMQVCGLPDLGAYRERLKSDPNEGQALLHDLLIGVTSFFRDHASFEALEREVIPQLFKDKEASGQVRAWVAACSTGEEAYSLAMLLCEQASLLSRPPHLQIFGTDLDERGIAACRAGVYPASIAADVPPARLLQFFSREENRYRIKKAVRDKILFAQHNLLRDPPFSRLDLITCRNLLIYLTRDVQARILEMFHFALNPGGYLFLGTSESADAVPELFVPVDKKNRIYRARSLAHSLRYSPPLPSGPVSRLPLADAKPEGARRSKLSFAQVHQRALALHAPPSVVVDLDSDIVHTSDGVGKFLRYAGGEPSHNLVSLALPELRRELRTILFQAIHKRKSVEAGRVRIERDGHVCWVNMVARPFHDEEAGADFVLVVFDEVEQALGETQGDAENDQKDAVMLQVEEELRRTKEQLQETVERSETSTEELKASNEELQAINEELRSATEELETSKEELQSVNEELVTVNHELKSKVEETDKVNDDLNNLIASTDIATIFVDQGLHIKRYTPRATAIFNIIPADIGRSLLDITHRLEYEQLAEDAAAAFESLRLVERAVRSNDDRYYIVRMLPYRTTDDRIEGAVLTFIDITSRRQAEEKARAGERRIKLFADSTKDYAIITMDTEGIITTWNKGAERIFGHAEAEALGQPMDLIFTPEDVAAGIPQAERAQARAEGRAEDERWHLHKDGSWLFCGGVISPLENEDFCGYAKVVRDLTERKRAESRHEADLAKDKAEREGMRAESMMKDQFLAVMSHELKQPLNLVLINAELLLRLPETRNSELVRKGAEIIRKSVIGQAKIIDDLLDLSRLTTGKLRLSLADVDLAAAIRSIVEVAQPDARAHSISLSLEEAGPALMVRADPVRLDQILWNLVSNALKFTPAGGRITVSLSQEKGHARLDVEDSGRGIAPEFLPHVFDIYRQADAPTTRAQGGLGIGLTLVQQLTRLHGGRTEAYSAGLGQGARFSVWLPLPGAPRRHGPKGAATRAPDIDGLRILVVDDMKEACDGLQAVLEFEGAQVSVATSAAAALELLEHTPVDLIISDIAMPGMDGYQFMEEARMRSSCKDVPAIALTGMGSRKDAARARAAGFSAHVRKPASTESLLALIMELRAAHGGAGNT